MLFLEPLLYLRINKELFYRYDEEIRFRILDKTLSYIGNQEYSARLHCIKNMDIKLLHDKLYSGYTLSGCEITTDTKYIYIFRELRAIQDLEIPFDEDNELIWDGKLILYSNVSGLYVRSIGKKDWLQIRTSIKNIPSCKYAKIFYTMPAVYNKNSELLALPLLALPPL